jgi:isopenicillin N synthase-like dioxygenase
MEPPSLIPTIDIGPYTKDPTSPEAAKIIADISHACKTFGFFQLVGHGISKDLQKSIFEGLAAFFRLPHQEKLKLLRDREGGLTVGGYEVIGSQGSEEGKLPDLSEVRIVP